MKITLNDLLNAKGVSEPLQGAVKALIDRLEEAEKERDNYKVAYKEWIEKTEWVQRGINDGTVPPKYLGWHRADVVADLLSVAERESAALQAKAKETKWRPPYGAIEKILTEVMDIATANGADSRSMPDEYVEVAAWLCGVPSAQPAPKAVAYLDLGVGGYMDIGTDLNDEQLASLPKGRHMLGIVGTYGVDGYVSAQPAPIIPEGWKLVPTDPTPGMIDAAEYVDWGDAGVRGSCINAWDRMLAAAPEAKP